jgi:hypothetical protein
VSGTTFVSAALVMVAVLASFGVVVAVTPTARHLRSRFATRHAPSWLADRWAVIATG